MNLAIRRGKPEDAVECGRINFEAFRLISSQHDFPSDFPSLEMALGAMKSLLSRRDLYGIVAELDGKVVGSLFMDARGQIAGIGPIAVDPAVQNRGIGRRLTANALDWAASQGLAGARLNQDAYHNRSLCLYTSLGFELREPLSKMEGRPLRKKLSGYDVRLATGEDLAACNHVCRSVHGHDRSHELMAAIRARRAMVVEHLGEVSGYATAIALEGHAVGKTTNDIKALIAVVPAFPGGGVFVPTRNYELFRWCLKNGFRLVYQLNLMSVGLYCEPTGAYLSSLLY